VYEAALCLFDPRLNRRKTIITILQSIQTTIAVIAVIAYERRLKQHLQGHRPTAKLFTFKLIVLIEDAQNTIFRILTSSGVFKPTFISAFMISQWGSRPSCSAVRCLYSLCPSGGAIHSVHTANSSADGHAKLGFWRGMGDCINTMDIIHGIGYLFKALISDNFGKKYVQGQRASDATIVESHVTPVHTGGESDPDGIQKTSVPVFPNEKV
jgi:hypothetical protein